MTNNTHVAQPTMSVSLTAGLEHETMWSPHIAVRHYIDEAVETFSISRGQRKRLKYKPKPRNGFRK